MTDDFELLRRYARKKDEAAFAELVQRHINLVYSTAVRRIHGSEPGPEDVTQTVFADLARKAASLGTHGSLAAWLHTSACFAASKINRGEQRRRIREEATSKMADVDKQGDQEPAWDELRPLIDDALQELAVADREVVLRRFFAGEKLAQISAHLGLSDNAARMRVERALERLRVILKKRGVTSTTSGLGAALALMTIAQAPAGLAATVTASAVAVGVAAPAAVIFITMSKAKLAVVASLGILAVGIPVWQQQKLQAVKSENVRLQTQVQEFKNASAPQIIPGEQNTVAADPASQVELERLRVSELKLRGEWARLRDSASGKGRAEATVAQLQTQLEGAKATEGMFTNAISSGLATAQRFKEQQARKELRLMTQLLDLTDEQGAAITAIKLASFERETEAVKARILGKGDVVPLNQGDNTEEQVKAILTQAQLDAYPSFKEQQNLAVVKESVTLELTNMKNILGLTTQQEQQLQPVLYKLGTEPTSHLPRSGEAPTAASEMERMDKRTTEKLARMEGILTPVQLATYRKTQEDQAQMMKNALKLLDRPQISP